MCLQKFPPSLQIYQNLPLDRYIHVLAEIPPWGADFPKSATGQIHTYACRNSPLGADIPNLPLDRYLHVLAEIPPGVQIFQSL